MKKFEKLIESKKISFLFLFGIYRSGTTILARSLAGEENIAFASDPIRPFFNWYRTILQKEVSPSNFENNSCPFKDYFNSGKDYIVKLLKSDFSEAISPPELNLLRDDVIEQGTIYSPKFVKSLKKSKKIISPTFADELKHYLSLIMLNYGNSNTQLLGLKEVWSIEMAFPIINMLGKKAKILVVIRDPLDIVASSIAQAGKYSILSLVRQWRKQVVFYNYLHFAYPNQVVSINYENFCKNPILTLEDKFNKLFDFSENFFSTQLKPIDDSGNDWMKNSSYSSDFLSNEIDKKSIGKYKTILNENEIEWVKYLTFMRSYKKYNESDNPPSRPKGFFPKRNIEKVVDWEKSDIFDLEVKNLKYELQKEHNRINKINSSVELKDITREHFLISQI